MQNSSSVFVLLWELLGTVQCSEFLGAKERTHLKSSSSLRKKQTTGFNLAFATNFKRRVKMEWVELFLGLCLLLYLIILKMHVFKIWQFHYPPDSDHLPFLTLKKIRLNNTKHLQLMLS